MSIAQRNKDNKEFFDTHADGYDEVHSTFMTTKKLIADSIDINIENVVDLGAGTGLELIELYKKFPNVHVKAIDLSSQMLNMIRSRDFSANVELINADFFTADFGNNNDAIISTSALHHFFYEEKEELYQKIYDALKDNGLFINCDKISSDNTEEQKYIENYINKVNKHNDTPLTVDHEIEILKKVGFKNIILVQPEKENYKLIKATK